MNKINTKPLIRPTVPTDLQSIAEAMREEDRMELFHLTGASPIEALNTGVKWSRESWTIERQGIPVAMFGVTTRPELPGIGFPWALATDDLDKCKGVIRECRSRLDGYLKEHARLCNVAWSKNASHIKWIAWLGFTFTGAKLERNGQTFLYFQKEE